MLWVEVFVAFVVLHLVGDFLLQTNWQALHKRGGLGRDPVSRRALVTHVTTYTLAFIPALIWIGDALGVAWALGVAVLIFIPHLIQDDGRVIAWWMANVKHTDIRATPAAVAVMVDQTFHILALSLLAVLVALAT